MQKNYIKNKKLSSIYICGGTPSLLEISELSLIFDQIDKIFSIPNNIEITLEANPDDLNLKKFREIKSLGVNRLSIGIQTFNDKILKFLNRSHDSNTAKKAIQIAREAKFENINLDLIYAIPGRNNDILNSDIDTMISYTPEHISTYCLTIEEKTVFHYKVKNGLMQLPNEENIINQYKLISQKLTNENYIHYEVSNFAKKNKESKHNSSYWDQNRQYLGIGPGAHSFSGYSRQSNIKNNFLYIKSIKAKKIPAEIEILTKNEKITETIFTGLRTKKGVNLKFLKISYNYDILEKKEKEIFLYENKNLIKVKKNFIVATESGFLLADEIAKKLMP